MTEGVGEQHSVLSGRQFGLGQEWGSTFGTAHGTDPEHPAYGVDRALGRARRLSNYRSSTMPTAPASHLEQASAVIEAGSQPALAQQGGL